MPSLPDLVGLVGVVLLLVAYFLLQSGRLPQSSGVYSSLNAAGSGLILVSLYFDFNLASVLVEGAWFVISLYGLTRLLRSSD
ncbi:MAG: cyclic nucleotide-binding protein [Deltaproteobacteria bacterium]|nr:cyclic nucleotide-binding protein [Deltaproteobacteria bacterium]